MDDKLTIKQASELTGYSGGHLRRLCKEGKHFKAALFGNSYAIDKESLLAFVKEQLSKGAPAGPR